MTATNMCSNFGGFRCRPPLDLARHIAIVCAVYRLFAYLDGSNSYAKLHLMLKKISLGTTWNTMDELQ